MLFIAVKRSVLLVIFLGFVCHRVEGRCRVQNCTNSSRCVLSKDQKSCKCITGYYGDHCDKNADIKVLCGSDVIGIRAKEDFFLYHNVSLEYLHQPNTSCHPLKTTIDNVTYYATSISKENYFTCGGMPLEKNISHITYSLSLVSYPQVYRNVIRNPVIRLEYKCVFPYARKISLPFPIIPYATETIVHMDDLDATIEMMLYTDHTYLEAHHSAPSIELRSKVYVEVKVAEPADFFLLRLNRCWATQTPEPNATESGHHVLLQNGCADDHTVSFLPVDAGQHSHNGSAVRYSFEMFRFTTEPPELYLHCSVQLCTPDDPESCTPNCNSISKREAVRARRTQGLLTYGPIKVDVPGSSQPNMWMTVVLPVAAIWTLGGFFLILIAVAKAGSRRLMRKPAC